MRYFIVSYTYENKYGSLGVGEITFNSNGFPNRNSLIDRIKTSANEVVKNVIIMNIIELKERDFNSYNHD